MSSRSAESFTLTPAQMLERFPATAKESVYNWPFADIPLSAQRKTTPPMEIRRHKAGGDLLRVMGLIVPDHYHDDPSATMLLKKGNDRMTLRLEVEGAQHYWQLAGLFMEASVELNKSSEMQAAGILHEVVGIEQPLLPTQLGPGVARGIVSKIRVGSNEMTEGMTLWAGGGARSISWGASGARRFAREHTLELDSVVAIGVDNHYWDPSRDSRYYVIKPPGQEGRPAPTLPTI